MNFKTIEVEFGPVTVRDGFVRLSEEQIKRRSHLLEFDKDLNAHRVVGVTQFKVGESFEYWDGQSKKETSSSLKDKSKEKVKKGSVADAN